ncbi:hypothetical protein AAII07_23790 [Microvirga sp. 0TCS3.31]
MGALTDPPWQATKEGDIESKLGTARGQIRAAAETATARPCPNARFDRDFPPSGRKMLRALCENQPWFHAQHDAVIIELSIDQFQKWFPLFGPML